MPELMKDDGDKQAQRSGNAHRPVGGSRESFVRIGKKTAGQGPGNEQAKDKPGKVNLDLKPEKLDQSYAFAKHLFPPVLYIAILLLPYKIVN
jgi:hypothetical protein